MNKKLLRKKLALMLANLKKKKPYYCEVEYLESTGTQYIDTGIKPIISDTVKPVIKLVHHFNTLDTCRIFGVTDNGKYFQFFNNATGSDGFGIQLFNTGGNYTKFTLDTDKHVYEISIASSIAKQDDTKQSLNFSYGSLDYNLYLFARNTKDSANNYMKGKIFYFEYDDGVQHRQFIPVLDWNMKPCLYDKVSGELFYNKATSGDDFIAGRQVHQVEYLESTGTQYIDTGIVPTSSMNAKIDFYISSTAPNREQHILGAMGGGGAQNGGRYQFLGVMRGDYNVWITAYGQLDRVHDNWGTPIYDEKVHFDITLQKGISTVYINNSTTPDWTLTYEEDVTTPSSIYMFALNNGGVPNLYSTCRIYSCSISHNGTLLRDYIPAVDQMGKAFFFDRVTHTIYDNAGSGDGFKYPPVELEYLESTGTQYIDTGVLPSEDLRTKVVQAFTGIAIARNSSILGSNGNGDFRYWINYDGNFEIGYGAYLKTNAVVQLNEVNTIDFNYIKEDGNHYFSFNGTEFTKRGTPNTQYSIILFGRIVETQTPILAPQKIYKVEFIRNNVRIGDFIPCYKDGKAGMWNKVNKKFYPNSGTDNFVCGPVKEPEYE